MEHGSESGQLVSGYLDFAEREQVMTMKDWAEHFDRILTMGREQLLQGNGSISHKQDIDKATDEYKARTLSTFDFLMSKLFHSCFVGIHHLLL